MEERGPSQRKRCQTCGVLYPRSSRHPLNEGRSSEPASSLQITIHQTSTCTLKLCPTGPASNLHHKISFNKLLHATCQAHMKIAFQTRTCNQLAHNTIHRTSTCALKLRPTGPTNNLHREIQVNKHLHKTCQAHMRIARELPWKREPQDTPAFRRPSRP